MTTSKPPILRLVQANPKKNANLAHRASENDGEAAIRLLTDQGYVVRKSTGDQGTCLCPFHEGPGETKRGKTPNFYINTRTSTYYCHSASCGERGNLQSLERHFGVGVDASQVGGYVTLDDRLVEYERALTKERRGPFYRQGLTDQTIERFRFGYDDEHSRYVIPYLRGRRPILFRYYQPDEDRYKYTWQQGTHAELFNEQDCIGDDNGLVLLCESELKAALAVQLGYAAVGVPGAAMWKPEWQAQFTHARKIVVVYDNDNPAFHNYDKDGNRCQKCAKNGLAQCRGHNPGQEAAAKRIDQLGWRARNVLLPLPNDETHKTDLNEYFVRDGGNADDFAEMVTGKRAAPFRVQTLGEIAENPPETATFLVEEGILSAGGRLLIAGPPKVGKSLLANHLTLSLAAGIPFLGKFAVDHPTRVLLLDRELSKASLFSRMQALSEWRPGYRAAEDNLMIDHDHLLRLDQPGAKELLLNLITYNGAEVCVLDTAYKFFGGDMEKSQAVKTAFGVLDEIIAETGCSFVLTHHQRKAGQGEKGHGGADPDRVAGSFLWTGWPNATILLNFLNRSVEDPFTALCSFSAFRDAAPPDALALHRSRESIGYNAITPHVWSDSDTEYVGAADRTPTAESLSALLLQSAPIQEEHFTHMAMAKFRCSAQVLKPLMVAVMASGAFTRTGRPAVLKTAFEPEVSSWESDHNLPERRDFVDVAMEME